MISITPKNALWILFVAALIYYCGKYVSRMLMFKNRQPRMLEELFESKVKKHGVSFETFVTVYKALEDCYSLDSRYIYPTDSIKKFFDSDSWDIDHGTSKMEDWLWRTFGINSINQEIKTVLDLLILVEKYRMFAK